MTPNWNPGRGFVILLAICLLALSVGQVGARGPTISDIQPHDAIFIYEEGLDLSQLRNTTTDNPITELRKYQNDKPDRGVTRSIPVVDDTDFEVQKIHLGGDYGTYYAFNPDDGATAQVMIREPKLYLDVVLADPHHNEPLEGLTVSPNTLIAFRVSAPDVGVYYRVGDVYPATIDIVLTMPGGGETTTLGGVNLAGLNVTSTRFYTDDPGMPGAVRLGDLGRPGEYSVRAGWRIPSGFDAYAPDTEPVTFTIANRVGVDTTATPTPTAIVTGTPTTAVPTTLPTTSAPVTETIPPTAVETAEPETPMPTAAPLPATLAVVAAGFALVLAGRRR